MWSEGTQSPCIVAKCRFLGPKTQTWSLEASPEHRMLPGGPAVLQCMRPISHRNWERCPFAQLLWEHALPWAVVGRQLRGAQGRTVLWELEAALCLLIKPPPSRGRVAEAGAPAPHEQEQLDRPGPGPWTHSPFLVGGVLCELLELAHSLAQATLI